jgi:hypothetical protein
MTAHPPPPYGNGGDKISTIGQNKNGQVAKTNVLGICNS